MLQLKRILCPTDFSEAARRAFDLAIPLAEAFGAELYVIHVIPALPYVEPRPTYHFDVPEYERALHEEAERQMVAFVNELATRVVIHPIIAHGDVAAQILRAAEEQAVDMIVIATHGRTGWRHLVFGSVAEKIVRLARCPVLTVRQPSA
ncbi:TRAP-T-associated universal stress protein TeaD [bacterium HR08]|nr:TRAP-T-associated universal stress protein TeaD [bacterium HR08]